MGAGPRRGYQRECHGAPVASRGALQSIRGGAPPPPRSAKRSLDNPETQSPATGAMPKTANMLGAKYTCKKYNDSRVCAKESHSRRHCCDILKPDNQLWSRITQGCSVLSARDCLRPLPALCILAPLSPQQILERTGSLRLADLGPTAVPAVASVS